MMPSHTPPPRSSRWPTWVAGIVLLVTLITGAVSILWSAATGRIDLQPSAWTLKDIISGKSALMLANELTRTPFPKALADAERAATWLVTGSLGTRVRRGCDSWLFIEDELTVHPNATQDQQQRLRAVRHVRDLLKRQGIELVVLTVPDKSRIQHSQLCHVYRPTAFADRLQQWEDSLQQQGVHVTPLKDTLSAMTTSAQQPFLQADTHWSQAGAHAAAQAILNTMDTLALELTPKQHYTLQQGTAQPYPGDLIRLAGVDWLPPGLQPPRDLVQPLQIQAAESAPDQTDSNDAAADLFGDTNLPSTALIGTSFSRTSAFTPLLEMALQTPVPSFAIDGGDFWGSASRYLNSTELRDTPPRVVIWEIPERVLQMPISPEEQAWMDRMAQQASAQSSP